MPSSRTYPPAIPILFFFVAVHKKCGVNGFGSAAEMICSHIPGLTSRQREMCRSAPDAMVAIGQGVRLGISECQHQFSQHRWNCTAIGKGNSFGHVVVVDKAVVLSPTVDSKLRYPGSREAAFTYGVASAGVAYSIASACSRGNISSCGCEPGRKPSLASSWKWGGCSVDIGYGVRFARRFLDAREIEGDARSLMNLQNNRAGRTAVKGNMVRECKCHGVSGSCTMRTCWKALPQFRQIGDHLMRKYWRARAVTLVPGVGLQTKRGKSRPRRSDLVFLEPSPNYCEQDLNAGSLGTVGRFCNRSSTGMGGCDLMCCGRGYNTHQSVHSWQCNCKFHWCCYVQCQTCSQRTEVYTCK